MEPKIILGLDLGTNSIGWALIEKKAEPNQGTILAAGSRILPMSQDVLGKFDSGISISQTAERTSFRGIRRLRERHLLRRERLHRVLHILGFLPKHYANQIDFEIHLGQFVSGSEPKLAYAFNNSTNQWDFIFKNSFNEMLSEFAQLHPLLLVAGKKIPYDWTLYYLRKKALKEKLEKAELAWLLLNFNQKRGYYQLRGEDEEDNTNKIVEYYSLKVSEVIATDEKKGNDETWYNVYLENGWIYRRTSKTFLNWAGKTKDFIVTTDLNEDGTVKTDKEGKEKRSFRAPAEDDWTLLKKKTEFDIVKSDKTIGTYIYEHLLQDPNQKINGKLVRVVERQFYRAELEAILKTQQLFHSELTDKNLYKLCLDELYPNNESHRNNIGEKDFVNLFTNDIIFFQRPLKSKKSHISNCKFESRAYLKEGKQQSEPIKCIAKSHPIFQEFRIWQWLQNLKIYEKETEKDITYELLPSEESRVNLFDWLNNRKEVDHKALLNYLTKPLKLKPSKYRWNYVYDESKDESKYYPCNVTRALIQNRLDNTKAIPETFLSKENEEALWHILYSVEDKIDLEKALKTFANKHDLTIDFIENFKKFPPFKKEYGSYSAKAIKKLLPLMRIGKYWNEDDIHVQTKDRIAKLINGEFDEHIRNRVREKAINLHEIRDFKGLPQWLASYIVYDRHSEEGEILKWKTAKDITQLEQHSLRNPIVEQVINETLKVVKDIWIQHGNAKEDFFNEIHIELGREMKNPSDKRKEMTTQINENENTNLRIKALLVELLNEGKVENVRPYSPMQQEIFKIYEEGVLNAEEGSIPDDIMKISKQAQPSSSDLLRYTLWLQQKYRSPYTGEIIPLAKLFTPAYQIEHIIPQSRFFDDSLSNKVICESEVNKDKDNLLGYEYIKANYGKTIELSGGKEIRIFSIEAYEKFVKENYSKSRGKLKKLLMEEIPESFIQRQLNDSRYISKIVKNLMSNIVREAEELESISKNVITCTGAVTSILKQDWGLNNVWNEIITPRFERLNELTKSTKFGEWTKKGGNQIFQTQVPIEFQRGFNKKRIDHRHHALDAIIIACASRNHINYLNNESALGKKTKEEKDKKRYDLKHKLCYKKYNDESSQNYKWVFNKPWDSFTRDTKETVYSMILSFKQNLRIINKSINFYQTWRKDEDGELKKELVKQTKGVNWAVRKPMHKDTVSGLIKLKFKKKVSLSIAIENWTMLVDKKLRNKIKELITQEYDKKKIINFFKDLKYEWLGNDVSKVEIYYWDEENVASRVKIDETFNSAMIKCITDSGIQRIMFNHLKKFNEEINGKIIEHPEQAFSIDGIDDMNKNLIELNGGKRHHPIQKVRTFEPKGNKFAIGENGNKIHKYVEAAKGTNLFFAIYKNEAGKRNYVTVPLNVVIERQKQGLPSVPEKNDEGYLLFTHLSPNDLVYVPTLDEIENKSKINLTNLNKVQITRIYKFVSCTGNEGHFVPHSYAKEIVKNEMGTNNKSQNTLDGIQIKMHCIKLNVDRLGNVRASK